MTRIISIALPLLTFVLITLTAASSTPDIFPDIVYRKTKRGVQILRLRSVPPFTIERRNPVDLAPEWAKKIPGNYANAIGRQTALGAEYAACVKPLHATDKNPTYPDVLAAVNTLDNNNNVCVPPEGLGSDGEHHCGRLAAEGSAAIYFCGAPGKAILCTQIAEAVLAFNPVCVDREGSAFMERGSIAILPQGWPATIDNLSFIVVDNPGMYTDV